MKRPRIYVDTSVFGGCYDKEFAVESLKLFQEIRSGKYILIVSQTTLLELEPAPDRVQKVMADVPDTSIQKVILDAEGIALRDAYIKTGILTIDSEADAEHIALATIAQADFLVSWNFKHIVHYDKINGFNAVNLLHGYKPIVIYSPKEVVII